jgi:drug/metabolite transporter (DMT)-like permease
MVSLLVHALLGIVVIVAIVKTNPAIFARARTGPQVSALEIVYYVVGVASIALGYYFNFQFVADYSTPSSNPIWGPGSWQQFIALGYANPAAGSASQDYTIINVILLPLFTIIDGRRRGIRHSWLFFVSSLFTSCAFAYAFYFATIERQRRHKLSDVEVASPV